MGVRQFPDEEEEPSPAEEALPAEAPFPRPGSLPQPRKLSPAQESQPDLGAPAQPHPATPGRARIKELGGSTKAVGGQETLKQMNKRPESFSFGDYYGALVWLLVLFF